LVMLGLLLLGLHFPYVLCRNKINFYPSSDGRSLIKPSWIRNTFWKLDREIFTRQKYSLL
jgi:hypothetical protein